MRGPGIVIGIMIVPYVSSVSEDAMRAVPMSLREGSYAMGATRFQTAVHVVTPAAISGIIAAYILGMSRAIGYQSIFAAGLVLFLMTLAFNILGHMARKRFREVY